MTEAQFQHQVIDLARLRGWKVAHFRTARIQRKDGSVHYATPVQADGAGWPDLFMVRGNHAIAAELKSDTGRVTAEQREWIGLLNSANVDAYIWRPKDWPQIDKTLR